MIIWTLIIVICMSNESANTAAKDAVLQMSCFPNISHYHVCLSALCLANDVTS